MKKSLIALAVLAASGVAMAQSSVTLYGVADLGLVKSNGISAQMTGNGTMNNGNSRLGVRGVEDLGGGLKASFNFEQGINAESGKTDANTFQRAAWLGLSGNFGSVRLGRSLTPSYYGMAAWELTGAANYSAAANQFGFVAAGSRNDSQFAYTTPNFGGFSATVGYIMKPDNGGNAKYDLNVIYANGPIAAALSYNKVKDFKGNASLGGSYDFGVAKIAASWQDGYKGGKGIAGEQKQSGFTIGGTVPVGAFSVTLDIARDTKAKDTDVVVEGKYALSKRTFAYAAYYKDGEKKLTTGAKNHLGLGIRHNF
ncbi:porin [Simplicispira metamorpha]|uniref:Putative porin n=1 Tax=Simplicispira metamorpha TaxID=80881 RepID=A0A4R2N4G2_9BURK|nr:porin [Simplicispira metamorpha]TCP15336.1 putative porin [Simplicispira metamorpha]